MRFAIQTAAKLFACILLLAAPVSHVSAKAWRGIQPLHSTRQDVVRLFNQCVDANESCEFDLGGEHVNILFSSRLSRENLDCIRKLPPETVLYIEVRLFARTALEDLLVEPGQLISFNPTKPHRPGFKAYLDSKDGWLISTFQGEVDQIVFIAAAKDGDLCPRYYRDPKRFIKVVELACAGLPPIVTLDCPSGSPKAESKLTISAHYTDDGGGQFVWRVSGGKIVEGQGTNTITLDAEGFSGQSIEVTVTVDDGNGHTVSTSCQIQFRPT